MNALKVINPVGITPAMLISSNVPETDYAAWAIGTTYAMAARVIDGHKIYESAQAGNIGHAPSLTLGVWWIEVSAVNRWKSLDTSNSTQTAQATSISYQLRPGQAVTAVAALNFASATTIRVRLVDPVYGTVYDKTASVAPVPTLAGWWSWFFGPRVTPTLFLATDLPSYPNADVLIDIAGGADLAVGVLMIGQAREIGIGVQAGARIGIQDYSRKETNDFGDTVLVQRAFAKRASFDMLLAKSEVDSTQDFLAGVRAVPCLWIGSGSYESTVIFGIYKDFGITIAYALYSDCTLEIEGLT